VLRLLVHGSLRYLNGRTLSPFSTEPEQKPSVIKSQLSAPGHDPGKKDVRMLKTAAVVHPPEILGNRSSHLVKLAGKIDSFSLLLREAPEGECETLDRSAVPLYGVRNPQGDRSTTPRYRSLSGEGILDFNTDCTSGQLEPGDLGKAPPPSGADSARSAASRRYS